MKFELEEWSEAHVQSVAKYANNEKIAGRLRDSFPYPYTSEDALWFIRDCMEKEGKTQFGRAIMVNNEAVGSISILFGEDVYCRSAELGYWLGEPFWRKGIMTEAVQKMCEEAFRRYKLIRIMRNPSPPILHPAGCWKRPTFSWKESREKASSRTAAFRIPICTPSFMCDSVTAHGAGRCPLAEGGLVRSRYLLFGGTLALG